MPIFRRSSNVSEDPNAKEASASGSKPSLLTRLSRRNSRSKSEDVPSQSHVEQQTPHTDKSVSTPATLQRSSSQSSRKSASSHSKSPTLPEQATSDIDVAGIGLSKDDVKALFSGAPQFMLEKGKHGAVFPQAFFPWNQDLEISDLQDRKYLKHETFTLATLHAHLPIPDELTWKPSLGVPQQRGEPRKRPTFDLGVFEVPNMLNIDGKLPGTVGLRYFLELPLTEHLRTQSKAKAEESAASLHSSSQLSSFEAFKSLDHGQGYAKIGKHAPAQDRMQLIQDGPSGWKRVGVRNISTSDVVERLSQISVLHDIAIVEGWQISILDKQDCESLHEQLFETFLYPPEKTQGKDDPKGLKVQIEALVKVLTTPGAWIDFSLVEWRIRLGQVLWALPPYQGHEGVGLQCAPGSERNWLLIQVLLSVELVVRLDAALRLGLAQKTERFHLSSDEIHHFNKLRNTKVNWDLVVARRFLDNLDVRKSAPRPAPEGLAHDPVRPVHGRDLTSFLHKQHEPHLAEGMSTWDCIILPRHSKLQLEGLMRFAKFIDWPSAEKIGDHLNSILFSSTQTPEELYATPIPSVFESDREAKRDEKGIPPVVSGVDWVAQSQVILHPAGTESLGGWMSRSWLTGLIIPSEATSDFLMACLLENDSETMSKLGNQALLHGGFILDGRSWWSKFCIIGRVFAPLEGGSECMGWISTPKLLPTNENAQAIPNGWLDIAVQPVPNPREGSRIHDGVKLAQESSPLGIGHGKVTSNEFEMVTDAVLDAIQPSVSKISNLCVSGDAKSRKSSKRQSMHTALAAFEIQPTGIEEARSRKLSLLHDVYFVTAYACQLPHGHAISAVEASQHHPQHKHAEHLPAHPLHKSYKYVVKSVLDLQDTSPPDASRDGSEVWILEARDQSAQDIYARAWCAQMGVNALIARYGKTCLSCAIREAKALQLGLIIRVGSSPSS